MLKIIGHWGLQLVIAGLLVACGGGGDSTINQGDQETSVLLEDGGRLKFPAGSLAAGTQVNISQVPLPLLTDDLVAVGKAWRVDIANQPTLPVEVTLPLPAGENADDLVVLRVESTGRISLLQTEFSDGMLVARTPGFSDVLLARKQKLLSGFKAGLNGPDFLPTNIAGQYSNSSMIFDPSVEREWHVFERNGDMGSQLDIDPRPLWDTAARLSAAKAGILTLMLEFSEPATGLNVVAMKDVSIQQAVDSGQQLDIAIYSPVVVSEGVAFNFSAVVLNTDISEMSRWEWSVGNHSGSCEAACSVRLDINGITLDNSGASNQLKVTAFAQSDIRGSATLDISVLKNQLRLVRLEKISSDNALLWDKNLNPNPQVTMRAEITGGVAPYVYDWHYYIYGPQLISVVHNSYEPNDQYTRTFDQAGDYYVTLTVTDSSANTFSKSSDINVGGAKPLQYGFVDVPTGSQTPGQAVSISLQASGGVLLRNGEVQLGYEFLIEWGDGASEFGTIAASNPDSGGNVTLQHTYSAEGSYNVRFILTDALRRPTLDDLGDINFEDLIRTTQLSIAADNSVHLPTEALCPAAITVELGSGTQVPLLYSKLVHPDYYSSYCAYEKAGVSGTAVWLRFNFDADSGACGQSASTAVIYTSRLAQSVQRTLSVVSEFSISLGFAPPPILLDEENILSTMVTSGVQAGLGSACP